MVAPLHVLSENAGSTALVLILSTPVPGFCRCMLGHGVSVGAVLLGVQDRIREKTDPA